MLLTILCNWARKLAIRWSGWEGEISIVNKRIVYGFKIKVELTNNERSELFIVQAGWSGI